MLPKSKDVVGLDSQNNEVIGPGEYLMDKHMADLNGANLQRSVANRKDRSSGYDPSIPT